MNLAPRQSVGLFHEVIAAPFVIGIDGLPAGFGSGGSLCGVASFGLSAHQVVMRGEVWQAVALEVGDRAEMVPVHEG